MNHPTYLRDETGGRRFWPLHCKAPATGKPWWLDSVPLNREASGEQADRYEGGPWVELILAWAGLRESVSVADVLTNCLEKKKDMWTQTDKNSEVFAREWRRFDRRRACLLQRAALCFC